MHDGRIEQIGSPLDLYDHPDNLFVAQFIGSPAMNVMNGKVRRGNGAAYVEVADGTRWPLEHGPGVEGQAVAVWQEDKGHGDRPYAQNITCLGHTGPLSPQIPEANVTPFQNGLIIKNIYPNPARNVLNVTISSTNQTNIRVYVTDVSGNVLLPSQRIMQQGNNLIQLDVSKLRAGTYFIKAANGTANAAALFNKQ